MNEQLARMGRDGTDVKDLSANDAPPLELLTAEQAKARIEHEPQIVQRVKGARYVIECSGPMLEKDRLETVRAFMDWWDGDKRFVLARRPIRISMVILPEVPD